VTKNIHQVVSKISCYITSDSNNSDEITKIFGPYLPFTIPSFSNEKLTDQQKTFEEKGVYSTESNVRGFFNNKKPLEMSFNKKFPKSGLTSK
jgi:hypothetical protein